MKVDVLLGLQWGDEGKGKIVDVLTPEYDVIARFQGGPNAGHTLEFDGIKHVLHTIPSGVFREDTLNVVGNGVVIDPLIFKKEIDALVELGVDVSANLAISRKAPGVRRSIWWWSTRLVWVCRPLPIAAETSAPVSGFSSASCMASSGS